MASIYGLFDSDGELRYIGKANKPGARLKGHMREVRRQSPLYDWIRKHGAPTMLVLEDNCEDWRASEREWIAAARLAEARLLNLADGGEQPFCSTEQRRANALKLNERRNNDPQFALIYTMKRRMGVGLRNNWVSNAARSKLREAARLRPDWFGEWANIPDREEAYA